MVGNRLASILLSVTVMITESSFLCVETPGSYIGYEASEKSNRKWRMKGDVI